MMASSIWSLFSSVHLTIFAVVSELLRLWRVRLVEGCKGQDCFVVVESWNLMVDEWVVDGG